MGERKVWDDEEILQMMPARPGLRLASWVECFSVDGDFEGVQILYRTVEGWALVKLVEKYMGTDTETGVWSKEIWPLVLDGWGDANGFLSAKSPCGKGYLGIQGPDDQDSMWDEQLASVRAQLTKAS